MNCCKLVSPWDTETLRRGLHQLVEAEFLYQRGLPPQATYLFKHALIQDWPISHYCGAPASSTISVLRRCWRRSFQRARPRSPELLAHHYTEAGVLAQAIPYGSGRVSAPSSAPPIWKRSGI